MKWKKYLILGAILTLLLSISVWTVLSPQILAVQTNSQITSSLFQFANSKEAIKIADGEGSFSFLFGMDYNETAAPGVPTIVEVFASLVGQNTSSGFIRGVGLQFTHSSVLIDGVEDSRITTRLTTSDNIDVLRLSQIEINQTEGEHVLTVHIIVSTVDVNYIGYLSGTEQVVSLNGSISIL